MNAIVIVVAGILIALWSGASLVAPVNFVGVSLLAIVLVGPMAARSGHVQPAVLRACGAMGLVLLTGVVTLNVVLRGIWIFPTPLTIFLAAVASLSAAAFISTIVVEVARRWSAQAATWTFRGLLAVILIAWKLLPDGLVDYAMERAIINGITVPVLLASGFLDIITVALSWMPAFRRTRDLHRSD